MLHIDKSPLSPRILEILHRNPIENTQPIENKEVEVGHNFLYNFPTEIMQIIFRPLLLDEKGGFCKNKIILLMQVSRIFLNVINEILTYTSKTKSYWIDEQLLYCIKIIPKILSFYDLDSKSLRSYIEGKLNIVQHIDIMASRFEYIPDPCYEYLKLSGTPADQLAHINPYKCVNVSASIIKLLDVLSSRNDIQTLDLSIMLNDNPQGDSWLHGSEEKYFLGGDNAPSEPEDFFSDDEEYNNIVKKRVEKIIYINAFTLIEYIKLILRNNINLNQFNLQLQNCGLNNNSAKHLIY